MDAEKRATWAAALRSGRYEQTLGALRDTDGYCCLGVMIDVLAPDQWERSDRGWCDRGGKYDESNSDMPSSVTRERLGINEFETVNLANLNDDRGFSFGEIASFIEQNEDLSVDPG